MPSAPLPPGTDTTSVLLWVIVAFLVPALVWVLKELLRSKEEHRKDLLYFAKEAKEFRKQLGE